MKNKRHSKILEIIEKNKIETQEELASRLKQEGFEVTQATVSRDIKELGLIKVQGKGGASRYAVSHQRENHPLETSLLNILQEAVTAIDFAKNILVVKTLSGMAQAAAYVMDYMELPHIVGTIAGDDCIMVVLRTDEDARDLSVHLKNILKQR